MILGKKCANDVAYGNAQLVSLSTWSENVWGRNAKYKSLQSFFYVSSIKETGWMKMLMLLLQMLLILESKQKMEKCMKWKLRKADRRMKFKE